MQHRHAMDRQRETAEGSLWREGSARAACSSHLLSEAVDPEGLPYRLPRRIRDILYGSKVFSNIACFYHKGRRS
jgi:hypothetical protein